MLRALQRRVRRDEPPCDVPGLLQQVGIRREPGMPHLHPARLAGPDQVAHPTLLQIQLRDPEPVRRRREGQESWAGAPLREKNAVALLRPAADPPPELMQLRQPEAIGMLDHHDGRVGHVDPDLDHRRRHQHLDLAGPETPHDVVALLRLESPVHQRDRQGRPAGGQRLGHAGGRPRSARSDSSMTGRTI